jgi:hypothetical protein
MTAHDLERVRAVHLVRGMNELRHPDRAMLPLAISRPEDAPLEAVPMPRECITRRPALHCPCGEFSRLLWVLDETEHGLTVAGGRHGLMGTYHLARIMLDQVRDPDELWARVYDQIERGLVEQGA